MACVYEINDSMAVRTQGVPQENHLPIISQPLQSCAHKVFKKAANVITLVKPQGCESECSH